MTKNMITGKLVKENNSRNLTQNLNFDSTS